MSTASGKPFFPSLDGLRTIACLQVYLFHGFQGLLHALQVTDPHMRALAHIFMNGHGGVSLFFVLSGFLITYLLQVEVAETGRLSVRNFYLRRFLRIWPLYYLLLTIMLVVLPTVRALAGRTEAANDCNPWYYFAFIGNFDVIRLVLQGLQGFEPVTITWSVGIEEQFYLVWPLLLANVARSRHWMVFCLVLFSSILFRVFNASQPTLLYFHSLAVFCDLALGSLAAFAAFNSPRFLRLVAELGLRTRLVFYSFGFALLLLDGYDLQFVPLWTALKRVPISCFFAFVILDQCFQKSERLKLRNFRSLCAWGKYTYGLYLLHPTALYAVEVVLSKVWGLHLNRPLPALLYGLLGLPLAAGLAYLSYHHVEKYFLKLKSKFG